MHILLFILRPPFCPCVCLLFPDMLCPAQIQLDNGDFWPRDTWLPIGATQSFSCHDGFTLYGSAQRNCTLTGEWTGTAPVCDKYSEGINHTSIFLMEKAHTLEIPSSNILNVLTTQPLMILLCTRDGYISPSSIKCNREELRVPST